MGALTLATLSDGIAFLANVTSRIESIIGFGVAAGVAVLSSYVIMGILLPLILMRLDERKLARNPPGNRVKDDGQNGASNGPSGVPLPPQDRNATPLTGIAWLIVRLAEYRSVILPVTVLVTAFTTYLSFQLDPKLDIKDFFDSQSGFVVGLDKLDQHTDPALAGEPAFLYIEGDLAARESLDAIQGLLSRLNDNPHLGRSEDGSVFLYNRTVFDLLRRVTGSSHAREQVLEVTGVAISDADGDGIPDTRDQTKAAYEYMTAYGVPLDEHTTAYDSLQVREVLYVPEDAGDRQATIIILGVLGSREQANLGAARESLERALAPLKDTPAISAAGTTGSPFAREATLTATTRALTISLPVAGRRLPLVADPLDAFGEVCASDHRPHWVGGVLVIWVHVPHGLQPQLRHGHHRRGLHRCGHRLLNTHDPAIPARVGKSAWPGRSPPGGGYRHRGCPCRVGGIQHNWVRRPRVRSDAAILNIRGTHRCNDTDGRGGVSAGTPFVAFNCGPQRPSAASAAAMNLGPSTRSAKNPVL